MSEQRQEVHEGLKLCLIAALVLGVLIVLWNLTGCARAGNGARAVEIPGPVNVVCYAILNERDETVGGSCLWQR